MFKKKNASESKLNKISKYNSVNAKCDKANVILIKQLAYLSHIFTSEYIRV